MRPVLVIKKGVSQLLLCFIVMQNIRIFYGGLVMFIVNCFFAQSDCRNFLPEHCNAIINWSKLMFFNKQGILQQINQCPSNKQKKKFISGLNDTNNFTQILTRMYYHAATKSLFCLCGAKISWSLTLEGVSYQFGFICFSICPQGKISGSSVFFDFVPMKFDIIK